MKNRKLMIILAIVLVVVLGTIGYYKKYRLGMEMPDQPILIDDLGEDTGNDNSNGEKGVVISKDDALQLAMEQIDLEEYTVSIAEKALKKGGEKYYLFDIVNKSGPSFGMQMAINQRSGDILAYDPTNQELLSMTQFPIETPIAQVQDWSGVFVPGEDSEATKGVSIELMQADQHSFEFKVLYENGEEKTFYEIASIDGSKAIYKSESGYEIVFLKDGEKLSIKEIGEGPMMADEIFLQGEYILKK